MIINNELRKAHLWLSIAYKELYDCFLNNREPSDKIKPGKMCRLCVASIPKGKEMLTLNVNCNRCTWSLTRTIAGFFIKKHFCLNDGNKYSIGAFHNFHSSVIRRTLTHKDLAVMKLRIDLHKSLSNAETDVECIDLLSKYQESIKAILNES